MKTLSLALVVCGLVAAQEKVDQAASARFRSEVLEKSQIMHTLHMLTDRYGPRVTGTPNHEAAAKWVAMVVLPQPPLIFATRIVSMMPKSILAVGVLRPERRGFRKILPIADQLRLKLGHAARVPADHNPAADAPRAGFGRLTLKLVHQRFSGRHVVQMPQIVLKRRTPLGRWLGFAVGFGLLQLLFMTIAKLLFVGVGVFGVSIPIG